MVNYMFLILNFIILSFQFYNIIQLKYECSDETDPPKKLLTATIHRIKIVVKRK